MAQVKSADTAPEIAVRRLVHRLGYRFRLHRRDLPGTPDLVLSRHRTVIFVHGCFWHQHRCRRGDRRPRANRAYWEAKLDRNVQRDARNRRRLRRLGWRVLTVWECQIGTQRLHRRIRRFLEASQTDAALCGGMTSSKATGAAPA